MFSGAEISRALLMTFSYDDVFILLRENWGLTFFKKLVGRICFKMKAISLIKGDHFINSHNVFVWRCNDIIRGNLRLVTLGTWRVKRPAASLGEETSGGLIKGTFYSDLLPALFAGNLVTGR